MHAYVCSMCMHAWCAKWRVCPHACAQVRFTCMRDVSDNVIVSVKEFPTCNYVFTVATPFLCNHPEFKPQVCGCAYRSLTPPYFFHVTPLCASASPCQACASATVGIGSVRFSPLECQCCHELTALRCLHSSCCDHVPSLAPPFTLSCHWASQSPLVPVLPPVPLPISLSVCPPSTAGRRPRSSRQPKVW